MVDSINEKILTGSFTLEVKEYLDMLLSDVIEIDVEHNIFTREFGNNEFYIELDTIKKALFVALKDKAVNKNSDLDIFVNDLIDLDSFNEMCSEEDFKLDTGIELLKAIRYYLVFKADYRFILTSLELEYLLEGLNVRLDSLSKYIQLQTTASDYLEYLTTNVVNSSDTDRINKLQSQLEKAKDVIEVVKNTRLRVWCYRDVYELEQLLKLEMTECFKN